MDLGDLPIIDWDQATQLAGNKRDLAEDILKLILRDLPKDIADIKILHNDQNHHELIQRVHKLHGALCYTGLPRLKSLIKTLETQLKNHIMDNSPSLIEQLDFEYNQLLKLSTVRNS